MHELRSAFRMLAAHRAFTIVAVATLALGIGANAAIFSLVDAVLLRPLPYPDSDRIVRITAADRLHGFVRFGPHGFRIWPPELGDLPAFRAAAMTQSGGVNFGAEPAERLRAAAVTPGFFETLGVRAIVGRTFTPDEFERDARVAVIGAALWQRRFGSDASMGGRTAMLNGRLFDIVGVMPPRVEYPDGAEIWVPAGTDDQLPGGISAPRLIARLAPGVTAAQARGAVAGAIDASDHDPRQRHPLVTIVPLRDAIAGDARPFLLLMSSAAALVLLVACINAANLLLARVAARDREFAVRRALGASHHQLVRQVACESLLLAGVAAATAIPIATITLDVLRTLVPASIHGAGDIAIDGRAIAATAGLALVTALGFGLIPSLSMRGREACDGLRSGFGGTSDRVWRRFRSALVVAEIAVALVLLAGAVTIVRKVADLVATDIGVRGERALTLQITMPTEAYGSADAIRRFYDRLDAALRTVRGVEEVGASDALPLRLPDLRIATQMKVDGVENPHDGKLHAAVFLSATPGYFAALGHDLIAGRSFRTNDPASGARVSIVNEHFARELGLPPASMVGRRVSVNLGYRGLATWSEVVGVVRDARMYGPERPVESLLYVPFAQRPARDGMIHLVIRTSADPRRLVGPVRAAVAALDPSLPLYNVRTFDEIRGDAVASRRFAMTMMLAFAGLAFALAAVGLYGVINYLVQLRTREIGIRIAIGASPSDVRRQVLTSGMIRAMGGIALGIAVILAVSRAIASDVSQWGRIDALTLAGLIVAVLAVSAAAAWVPARRATRVDPLIALRAE